MPSKKRKWCVPLPLLFLVFASCAVTSREGSSSPAPQQQVIQTIQPGDSQLTCEDLMTQMGQMDQLAYGSPAGGNGTKNTAVTSLVGTAAKQGIKFIPVVGSFLGPLPGVLLGTVGNADQQRLQQQNTIVQAQQRKQHLITLYDDKKCYARSPGSQPQ
jgi:hypothetical protein